MLHKDCRVFWTKFYSFLDEVLFVLDEVLFVLDEVYIDISSKFYIINQGGKFMNEIVKYDNYMNSLKFTGFTTTDFNFLMLLCSKMRDKDIAKLTISFDELRSKTGYTQHPIKQFVSDLKRMNDKLMKITCSLETETEIIMFVLFPTFKINLENQMLTVCVNEEFKFILNNLVKNFTRFELKDFIELQSRYSKALFRILKQFKSTGILEISLNDFIAKMDIPKSYRIKDITDKVINPSLKELRNYFTDLQCTVQYAHKRGKPVEGYVFTFAPEKIPKSELPAAADKPSKPRAKKGISKEEKDRLVEEFGKEIVEDYIERTTNYKCCNYTTIKKWIAEDREKHKHKDAGANKFNDFPQRDYGSDGMNALERQLLGNE